MSEKAVIPLYTPQFAADLNFMEFFELIEKFDANAFPPHEAAGKNEEVIGELNPLERQLAAYTSYVDREAERYTLDMKYLEETSDDYKRIHLQMHKYILRMRTASQLMWFSINSRMNIDTCGVILQVRKDWKITRKDQADSLLKALLGRGSD